MVVKDELCNFGIGLEMMLFCEKVFFKNGKYYIYCYVRDMVMNFYLNNNYLIEGEYFLEDGILYVKMVKYF